jgi:hypothetical protein
MIQVKIVDVLQNEPNFRGEGDGVSSSATLAERLDGEVSTRRELQRLVALDRYEG